MSIQEEAATAIFDSIALGMNHKLFPRATQNRWILKLVAYVTIQS